MVPFPRYVNRIFKKPVKNVGTFTRPSNQIRRTSCSLTQSRLSIFLQLTYLRALPAEVSPTALGDHRVLRPIPRIARYYPMFV